MQTTFSSVHLEQTLNKIYDHLYANAESKTPKAIAFEVMKILHTAVFMEKESQKNEPAFHFLKTEQRKITSGNPDLVRMYADMIRKQFERMKKAFGIFAAKERIALADFDLVFVCSALSTLLVSDPKRDVLGDALEIFRSYWAKSHGGQFFTDQRVTRLAMTLLQFNPYEGDDLVDICAGTGGFLFAGLHHIQELVENRQHSAPEQEIKRLAAESLLGQEIDADVCAVANATLSSRIGNGIEALVRQGNSLVLENSTKIRMNTHRCVATNPPFGTKITIKDPSILRQYELSGSQIQPLQGNFFAAGKLSPRAPDTLFVEQNVKLLQPGVGRLAIVIPYQIASGPQAQFIREWLLKQVSIVAVIDLPADTFQPHTGTKACLLVVKRRKKPLAGIDLTNDPPIFCSVPRWIGHDRRGNPTYKKLPDGTESDEVLSDFEQVAVAFEEFLQGQEIAAHSESFVIGAEAIAQNEGLRFDAQFHKPQTLRVRSEKNGKNKDSWEFVRLGDVVKHIFYPGRFKRNYIDHQPDAVPFLGGTNISQLIINTDKWISPHDPRLEELKVRAGWVLITRSGSTGIISSVPQAWDGAAISEHVIRIIPDETKLEGAYIQAFLRTQYAQQELARGVYGSVIDEINPEFIGNLSVPVPRNRKEMKSIVESMRRAEDARQTAIEAFQYSVQSLDSMLLHH